MGRAPNFIRKRFTADLLYFVLFTFLLLLVVLWRAIQSPVLTLLLSECEAQGQFGKHSVQLLFILVLNCLFLQKLPNFLELTLLPLPLLQ